MAKKPNLFEGELDLTGYLGFPAYDQDEDKVAPYNLEIIVRDYESLCVLADLINQPTLKNKDRKTNTKSIWYPELEYGEGGANAEFIWVDEDYFDECLIKEN